MYSNHLINNLWKKVMKDIFIIKRMEETHLYTVYVCSYKLSMEKLFSLQSINRKLTLH